MALEGGSDPLEVPFEVGQSLGHESIEDRCVLLRRQGGWLELGADLSGKARVTLFEVLENQRKHLVDPKAQAEGVYRGQVGLVTPRRRPPAALARYISHRKDRLNPAQIVLHASPGHILAAS